jgi:5-methylcytosine-specific restriction endonuclease McrA
MAKWPYSDPRWGAVTKLVRRRDGNRCVICGRGRADGVIIDVDHVQRWTVRPDLVFNPSNLQCLCRTHHNRKTKAGTRADANRHSRNW